MRKPNLAIILVAMVSGGCSGGPSLTTGSLFGGNTEAAKPAAPEVKNDPTARAYQVGAVSARAMKCGFYFNPTKLRTSFLAAESTAAPAPAALAGVEKMYDVTFNAVSKAVSAQSDYCNPQRTKEVKADLTRHLAGDYSPSPPRKDPEAEEEGLFSGGGGLFSGSSGSSSGPAYGSNEWWDKQEEKAGSR